jgi:hypothetical protein
MQRYYHNFFNRLDDIDKTNNTWIDKIKIYADIYQKVLSDQRLCLCISLASDMQTLPKKIQKEVRYFLDNNIQWLMRLLPNKKLEVAQLILSTLQGGMLYAKTLSDQTIFTVIVDELLIKIK